MQIGGIPELGENSEVTVSSTTLSFLKPKAYDGVTENLLGTDVDSQIEKSVLSLHENNTGGLFEVYGEHHEASASPLFRDPVSHLRRICAPRCSSPGE